MKIFITSKLKHTKHRELNEELANLCEKLGFEVLLPQKLIPLDTSKTALEILEKNERLVDIADVLLAVFDRAESGVAMELGRAHILNKPVIGFRTDSSVKNEDLGKMMQGFWDRLPLTRKATNIEELKDLLEQFFV